ncbi:MAG: hypothetical protein ABI948_12615 [Thermoleophilia bacterium]
MTRAVRGTPSIFAHAIAFVLGGSLAALVTRRPQDDRPASAPLSLPAATAIEADEPEEPAVASWEWAAEPAPQPAEFATESPAWSPNQVWERMQLDDPDDFEPAPAMPIAPVEDPTPSVAPAPEPEDEPRPRLPHRFAATAAMVTLFFAGAAFSAGAGDQVASMLDTTTTTEATAAASSDSAAPAADPAAEPAAPASDSSAADASAAAPAPEAAPADDPAPASAGSSGWSSSASSSSAGASASGSGSGAAQAASSAGGATKPPSDWVQQQGVSRLKQAIKTPPARLDPEASMPGMSSVIWLNRAMPDPTPAAKRLTDAFAHDLTMTSKRSGADWALVLGVLRASGAEGKVPAGHATLRGLGLRLANLKANGKDDHEAVFALTGDSMLADKAVALANYDRAVGQWALVHGLEAAKPALTKRVLSDSRIDIYVGGREDLANNKINVRVIALMAYMAETFNQVTVSCLLTGHRLYARPGVVSAHMYGHAVDFSAVGGTTIQGNQEPGGITEQAVRDVLLLPSELQPKQVISLLGLGGASFPLPNHADHIHVGY